MSDLEARARDALREAGAPPGCLVLVAVSGGPDSTALLRSLCSIAPDMGIRLRACTIDHGIREPAETAADTRFVEELCARLGVPVTVRRIPAGECARQARERRSSLEETARDLRLALLRGVADEEGASLIALGHTEDDNIETLLMRMLAGADVEGLRGIMPTRGALVRPLLRCSRREVIAYLESLGQGWREDPTNADRGFLRNRVRHALVPLLEEEFPGFRTGVLSLARKASLASDVVASVAAGLRWKREGSVCSLPIEDFLGAPPAVRSYSLLSIYDRVKPSGSPRRLPSRFLDSVVSETSLPDDRSLLRGYGMLLRTSAGQIHWGPDIARQGKKGYFIEVSATGDVAVRGAGMRLRVQRGTGAIPAGAGDVSMQVRDVKMPLVLRSRRKGDVIVLPGGVASVNGLMAGWKIPAPDRDRVPILVDRDGVLAVLGGALGYRNRARADAHGGGTGDAGRVVVHIVLDMEEGREQQQRQR